MKIADDVLLCHAVEKDLQQQPRELWDHLKWFEPAFFSDVVNRGHRYICNHEIIDISLTSRSFGCP